MTGYDYKRPYIDAASLALFKAINPDVANRYGQTVMATSMGNFEYAARYSLMSKSNNMKEPPGIGRKFLGYLVIRRLCQPNQYETWMPEDAFEETYEPISN